MILKLTLGTGDEVEIPFDETSALTVTTVVNIDGVQTEKAQAHADVVGIELVEGTLEPAPPEVVQLPPPSAQDVQVPISETVGQPNPGTETPDLEGGDPGDVGPQGTPNPVVQTAEGITDDAGLTSDQPTGVPSIDESVSAAQDAVEIAAAGAAADPAAHVEQALVDVNKALEVYPDSIDLQDAKTQLETIAGAWSQPSAPGA